MHLASCSVPARCRIQHLASCNLASCSVPEQDAEFCILHHAVGPCRLRPRVFRIVGAARTLIVNLGLTLTSERGPSWGGPEGSRPLDGFPWHVRRPRGARAESRLVTRGITISHARNRDWSRAESRLVTRGVTISHAVTNRDSARVTFEFRILKFQNLKLNFEFEF